MLNLPIAMARVYLWVLAFIGWLIVGLFQTQTAEPAIQVTAPLAGMALQGSVVITGNTTLPDFQSAEVDFSYIESGPINWFLLQQSESPVKDSVLAVWDTSKIADGNYQLRVQVFFKNGQVVEKIVPDLRVRNYTAIETSTPTLPQVALQVSPMVTLSPTAPTGTPIPTPTTLPANPVQVQSSTVWFNIVLGISFVTVVFGLLGLYLWLRGRGR
ncbi:MAG TPA: hypothetical protein VMS73_00880 [Anaerolineaceae bacterium]|nr:hypothetical protein [Anaerolineaceae bacterium]